MFPVQGSATALVAQTRHREPVPWRTTRSKFRHFFHLFDACYNLAYQLGQQGKVRQAKALAERAAKGAAKVLGLNNPYIREYAKFLEELESGHAITMPESKFREQFIPLTIAIKHASR